VTTRYVPKGTQQDKKMPKQANDSKQAKQANNSKQSEEEVKERKPAKRGEKAKTFYNLLSSSLKPGEEQAEESPSDDEVTKKMVARKLSLNRINAVGLNFE
jgi:hypothetical protein